MGVGGIPSPMGHGAPPGIAPFSQGRVGAHTNRGDAPMGSAKRVTTDERQMVRALWPSYGVSDIARKLGRSRNTISKVISQEGLREAAQEPAHGPAVDDRAPGDGGDQDIERLRELRGVLRRALFEAPPGSVAGIAREYRATVEAIARAEGDDGDGASSALDTLASAISAKLSP